MAWFDEAVFYHIYPLGLLGAPKQNDYGETVHRLRELFPWISHIKKIGCTAIYIGPLFESVGHGYETTDYMRLDRRLGDNQDLKEFVAECHAQGLRVIFDGVFNHTGRDFFAFSDIRQYRENSRYRDWYCNVNFWGNNEYNDGFSYDNWGGYNLLAKLNQRNPEVRDYICQVIRFWVREFDVDGIRLDAADVLDFDFMKTLRWVAGEVKPDFWLMGEVIHGEYSRWVNGETLHSVTNYHLHKALFSGHNDHNYFEIAHTVKRLYGMGGNQPNGLKLYNFVDNHDVERIYTKLSNKANFLPAHILLYTLPGVPSLYYGSEFGIEGHKYRGGSDDEIRPYLNLGDFADAYEKNDCTRIVTALGRVRQQTPALSYGDYRELALTTKQYTFARSLNGVDVIVSVNNDENECDIYAGGAADGSYVGALTGSRIQVQGGNFHAHIYGNSGEIFIPEGYSLEQASYDLAEMAKRVAEEQTRKKAAEEEARKKAEEARQAQLAAQQANTDAPAGDVQVWSASAKYGLGAEYAWIDPAFVDSRRDYENMSIEELQVAILEKMVHNGPVNDQMKRTVMDNRHQGSLCNWVRSFR